MKIRFLGTTCFVIEGDGHVLVTDPYVTRPGLVNFSFGKVRPDADLIEKMLPQADDVLIGHSHIDHILDAPDLCRQTGARLIGSASACQVGRAGGLSGSHLVPVVERTEISSGPAKLTILPSRHGRFFGKIPLPGEIENIPPWPPRTRDLLCGMVLDYLIELEGKTIVFMDSADFIDEHFEGIQADILLLCAVGRKWRPNYVSSLTELLKPKLVIPCHWDWLFTSWGQPMRPFPGIQLPSFVSEIEAAGSEAVVLGMDETFDV